MMIQIDNIIYYQLHKSLYLPDALIVRNKYMESFLFVFYCETYSKYIPRKVYYQLHFEFFLKQ